MDVTPLDCFAHLFIYIYIYIWNSNFLFIGVQRTAVDRKEKKGASYDIETRFIIIKKKYSIRCREKLPSIKKN